MILIAKMMKPENLAKVGNKNYENKNPTSSQVKNIGNAFEKCEQLQETRLVK